MEGRMTVHIAVLSAQCTEGHDLVLTMAVQQVLSMVHMAGAGVLFVIDIEGNALTLFLFDLHMVAFLVLLADAFIRIYVPVAKPR